MTETPKCCFDRINNTLRVGDWVAYARKSGKTAGKINFGTVNEIYPQSNEIQIRNEDTKRCSINLRSGDTVLQIQVLKDEHP